MQLLLCGLCTTEVTLYFNLMLLLMTGAYYKPMCSTPGVSGVQRRG